MKQIKKIEKVYQILKEWKPSDLAFIKKLDWSNNNLSILFLSQTRSDVPGWPDISKDFLEISLLFETVSNLKLNFESSGVHQITGFDIIDVSNNSLENINYQIEDYENGSINFCCKEISVESVSNAVKLEVE
jgi:hypothetical protein